MLKHMTPQISVWIRERSSASEMPLRVTPNQHYKPSTVTSSTVTSSIITPSITDAANTSACLFMAYRPPPPPLAHLMTSSFSSPAPTSR